MSARGRGGGGGSATPASATAVARLMSPAWLRTPKESPGTPQQVPAGCRPLGVLLQVLPHSRCHQCREGPCLSHIQAGPQGLHRRGDSEGMKATCSVTSSSIFFIICTRLSSAMPYTGPNWIPALGCAGGDTTKTPGTGGTRGCVTPTAPGSPETITWGLGPSTPSGNALAGSGRIQPRQGSAPFSTHHSTTASSLSPRATCGPPAQALGAHDPSGSPRDRAPARTHSPQLQHQPLWRGSPKWGGTVTTAPRCPTGCSSPELFSPSCAGTGPNGLAALLWGQGRGQPRCQPQQSSSRASL